MHPNIYKHPRLGISGRTVEAVVNNKTLARLRRALLSKLPFLRLRSDVADVVYLTWLIPVQACERHVPPGVQLWQRDGLTPFTVLSYRHAHFAPSFLGVLRRFFPSPFQSNWRLYLKQVPEGERPVRTVLFLKNVMSSLWYTLATRLFSDALPTHLPAKFIHKRTGNQIRTEISRGEGSSPELCSTVDCGSEPSLSKGFQAMFGSWAAAVEFLALQDAALAAVDGMDRVAFAEIDLPINMSQVVPAACVGEVHCSMLRELQPVEGPFCFVVRSVPFEVLSERLMQSARIAHSSEMPAAANEFEH